MSASSTSPRRTAAGSSWKDTHAASVPASSAAAWPSALELASQAGCQGQGFENYKRVQSLGPLVCAAALPHGPPRWSWPAMQGVKC